MSGGAIMGAAAIGAGSSYLSGRSASKASKKASDSAAYQAELQADIAKQQLDFNIKQYDDWTNIFGDVQQTLSSYYKNLTPDAYAAMGIQNIEQEYSRSLTQLDTQLAKRGISNSGIAGDNITNLEVARMLGRANARTSAEDTVRAQQLNFLGVGKGQQSQLQQQISSSYGNMANAAGQQANTQYGLMNNYSNQANQAYSGIGNAVGSGINAYMMYNATQGGNSFLSNTGGNTGGSTYNVGTTNFLGGDTNPYINYGS